LNQPWPENILCTDASAIVLVNLQYILTISPPQAILFCRSTQTQTPQLIQIQRLFEKNANTTRTSHFTIYVKALSQLMIVSHLLNFNQPLSLSLSRWIIDATNNGALLSYFLFHKSMRKVLIGDSLFDDNDFKLFPCSK
jgi:hypothetical protein